MEPFCDCLIPFHNEGRRVLAVLAVVSKIQEIDSIICVDDGSEDQASEWIKERYPQVKLVRLEKNQGKTGAVREGLKRVKAEYVLLLDADLEALQVEEIKEAIEKVKAEPAIDMIILRRLNDPLSSQIIRGDILVSGERILRRRDLGEVLAEEVEGYELELAMNNYMMKNFKKVYWLPNSAVHPYKFKKRGFLEGAQGEAEMYFKLISRFDAVDYLEQVMTFCRERAGGGSFLGFS